MKKLLLLLCLILIPALTASDTSTYVLAVSGQDAGCSASYGTELNTDSNAIEPDASDTDATTGWTSSGTTAFESISTESPHIGTYHFHATADGPADRFYKNLADYSLSAGSIYKLSYHAKHSGSGADWWVGLNYASAAQEHDRVVITSTDSTYTQHSSLFIYNTEWDYFVARANGASEIYVDNFTVKAATLCYGTELYTGDAGATAEENDVSNWTGSNIDTLESTSSGTPQAGTYHIHINENTTPTSSAYAYVDIGTAFSLVDDTKYFIRLYIKHVGTGGAWSVGLSNTASSTASPFYNYFSDSMTTYKEYGFSFVYSSSYRYLVAREANASNDGGVYIDGISIKEITAE